MSGSSDRPRVMSEEASIALQVLRQRLNNSQSIEQHQQQQYPTPIDLTSDQQPQASPAARSLPPPKVAQSAIEYAVIAGAVHLVQNAILVKPGLQSLVSSSTDCNSGYNKMLKLVSGIVLYQPFEIRQRMEDIGNSSQINPGYLSHCEVGEAIASCYSEGIKNSTLSVDILGIHSLDGKTMMLERNSLKVVTPFDLVLVVMATKLDDLQTLGNSIGVGHKLLYDLKLKIDVLLVQVGKQQQHQPKESQKKKKTAPKRGRQTMAKSAERIGSLQAIGFSWAGGVSRGRRSGNENGATTARGATSSVSWDERFQQLVEYKDQNGHCRVPAKKYEPNPQLGLWVDRQRQLFKKNKLSPEQKERLEGIGFIWVSRRGPAPAQKREDGPMPDPQQQREEEVASMAVEVPTLPPVAVAAESCVVPSIVHQNTPMSNKSRHQSISMVSRQSTPVESLSFRSDSNEEVSVLGTHESATVMPSSFLTPASQCRRGNNNSAFVYQQYSQKEKRKLSEKVSTSFAANTPTATSNNRAIGAANGMPPPAAMTATASSRVTPQTSQNEKIPLSKKLESNLNSNRPNVGAALEITGRLQKVGTNLSKKGVERAEEMEGIVKALKDDKVRTTRALASNIKQKTALQSQVFNLQAEIKQNKNEYANEKIALQQRINTLESELAVVKGSMKAEDEAGDNAGSKAGDEAEDEAGDNDFTWLPNYTGLVTEYGHGQQNTDVSVMPEFTLLDDM